MAKQDLERWLKVSKRNSEKDKVERAKTLAKEAAKGVGKELGEISKGVLSELFKLATLQKK